MWAYTGTGDVLICSWADIHRTCTMHILAYACLRSQNEWSRFLLQHFPMQKNCKTTVTLDNKKP